MIDNPQRFILVLDNDITEVNRELEAIRQNLQEQIQRIVLIETVNLRRFLISGILDLDPTGTDVTFVVVNHLNRQYTLYDNNLDTLNL